MKTFLLDVNVWIALAFDMHTHHTAAASWFKSQGKIQCGFCRTTQQGFLRVATNRKAMLNEAMSLPQAWQTYDIMLQDPRISFFEEPFNLESHWRALTEDYRTSPKIWTDAYLAAFAVGLTLNSLRSMLDFSDTLD